MARLANEALNAGRDGGLRFHLAIVSFAAMTVESIDYAVIENIDRAAMVPVNVGWSDNGSWATMADSGTSMTISSEAKRLESRSFALPALLCLAPLPFSVKKAICGWHFPAVLYRWSPMR